MSKEKSILPPIYGLCVICGKKFEQRYRSKPTKTCSKECSNELRKIVFAQKRELEEKLKEQRKSKKPKLSVADINRLAREKHISYGQYVARYM